MKNKEMKIDREAAVRCLAILGYRNLEKWSNPEVGNHLGFQLGMMNRHGGFGFDNANDAEKMRTWCRINKAFFQKFQEAMALVEAGLAQFKIIVEGDGPPPPTEEVADHYAKLVNDKIEELVALMIDAVKINVHSDSLIQDDTGAVTQMSIVTGRVVDGIGDAVAKKLCWKENNQND